MDQAQRVKTRKKWFVRYAAYIELDPSVRVLSAAGDVKLGIEKGSGRLQIVHSVFFTNEHATQSFGQWKMQ